MKHLILLFLFLFNMALAQTSSLQTRLDSLAQSLQTRFPQHGISIGLTYKDHNFYAATGQCGTLHTQAIDRYTIFETGSVTKTFTGLLLALAIEKQDVKGNDYIDGYLPKTVKLKSGLRQKIKLTDLASHQSGLPNLTNDRYINALFQKNPEQPFSLVSPEYLYEVLQATDSLDHYGQFHYNNYAFSLLGQLLQQSMHASYEQLLTTHIIQPLHLKLTGLSHEVKAVQADRYDSDGKPKPAIALNAVAPAGGLNSTTEDLMRYIHLQLNPPNSLLGRAARLSQKVYYTDAEGSIGLGWEVSKGIYEKSGDTFGNSSLLRFDPAAHWGLVILCDHQDAKLVADLAKAVQGIIPAQP